VIADQNLQVTYSQGLLGYIHTETLQGIGLGLWINNLVNYKRPNKLYEMSTYLNPKILLSNRS